MGWFYSLKSIMIMISFCATSVCVQTIHDSLLTSGVLGTSRVICTFKSIHDFNEVVRTIKSEWF